MNKKKKYDINSLIAAISVFTTFVLLIITVVYSISAYHNKIIAIILWGLLALSFLTFVVSIVKFALGNPRLKNK